MSTSCITDTLIPVLFALAGTPHWAEQVLTHFLVFEVTVPLSSHRQPKVERLFSTQRRKILLKSLPRQFINRLSVPLLYLLQSRNFSGQRISSLPNHTRSSAMRSTHFRGLRQVVCQSVTITSHLYSGDTQKPYRTVYRLVIRGFPILSLLLQVLFYKTQALVLLFAVQVLH